MLLVAVLAVASAAVVAAGGVAGAPVVLGGPAKTATCGACLGLFDEAGAQLLNIILNAGVLGDCSDLCTMLPNPTVMSTCTSVCDAAGITPFVTSVVRHFDGGPVCLCGVLEGPAGPLCPWEAKGKVDFAQGSPTVAPAVVQPSGKLEVTLDYEVAAAMATGLVNFTVSRDGDRQFVPVSTQQFLRPTATGKYELRQSLQAMANWQPGTFTVNVNLWQGPGDNVCTSTIQGALLAKGKTSFELK